MSRRYHLLDHPNPHRTNYTISRERCRHGISALPHLIVVHTAENVPDFTPPDDGAERVATWASTGTDCKVSWHVTVDSDSIVWMLPDAYEAWHAGAYNDCALGIEMATKAALWTSTTWQWREAMLRNCARVLAEWSRLHNIPLTWLTAAAAIQGSRGVVPHSRIDPANKSDPGAAFPYAWTLERAAEYKQQAISTQPTGTPVLGSAKASIEQALAWALSGARHRGAVWHEDIIREVVLSYWRIGFELGVRPDLALAMSAKETGFWSYKKANGTPSPVRPEQWNMAGVGATGGVPGITFDSLEHGVRGHMLRMYMYANNDPSKYNTVTLGRPLSSEIWGKCPMIEDFNGIWAVPGDGYGESIVKDYLTPMLSQAVDTQIEPGPLTLEQRVASLEVRVGRLEAR